MNFTILIPLIVFPAGIFLGAFVMARQMRTLGNMPAISVMFVKRRLVLSVFTSGVITLILGFLLFFHNRVCHSAIDFLHWNFPSTGGWLLLRS